MVQTIAIRVTGRVQGVFFRARTKEQAQALNVTGFVRNEPDGTVYIEAQGEEENLKQFITWCKQGPPLAKVENVGVTPVEGNKSFSQFEILR